jgi:hypothetical protein
MAGRGLRASGQSAKSTKTPTLGASTIIVLNIWPLKKGTSPRIRTRSYPARNPLVFNLMMFNPQGAGGASTCCTLWCCTPLPRRLDRWSIHLGYWMPDLRCLRHADWLTSCSGPAESMEKAGTRSPAPIGPSPPARRCSYRLGCYAPEQPLKLEASLGGWDRAKRTAATSWRRPPGYTATISASWSASTRASRDPPPSARAGRSSQGGPTPPTRGRCLNQPFRVAVLKEG